MVMQLILKPKMQIKMKKIFITLLLITQAIFVYSQLDPNFQPAGGIVIPYFGGLNYVGVTIHTPTGYGIDGSAFKLASNGYELSETLKEDILDYCLE